MSDSCPVCGTAFNAQCSHPWHQAGDSREAMRLAAEVVALKARLAGAEPDALRYRWLMQHHGEAIRKAIAPSRPGDVVQLTDSADVNHSGRTTPQSSAMVDSAEAIIESAITPDNQPPLSKRLAAAGYTKRDTRLQCDECGKWFTPQLLPAHQCASDQPDSAPSARHPQETMRGLTGLAARGMQTARSAPTQPPAAITFPEDMPMSERIGDPRIDGRPEMSVEEHCRMFCAWKGGGPCLADDCPRRAASQPDAVACWCHKCNEGRVLHGLPWSMTVMILCPECGNKRCPHASDHALPCTGSNEPGQPGSVYGPPRAADNGPDQSEANGK